MTQVVSAKPYTLESSMQLTRPDFKSYLRPDTNIGQTNITTFNELKKMQDFHVPNTPLNYQVKCCENSKSKLDVNYYVSANLVKNKGVQLIDPLSNFISPAGEFLLNSGKTIPPLGKKKKDPHKSKSLSKIKNPVIKK